MTKDIDGGEETFLTVPSLQGRSRLLALQLLMAYGENVGHPPCTSHSKEDSRSPGTVLDG